MAPWRPVPDSPLCPRLVGSRSSDLYREARTEYELLSDPELDGVANGLEHELAAAVDFDSGSAAVHRVLVGDRLQAARDVAAKRVRRHACGAGPDPSDGWTEGWRAVAQEVRDLADIVEVFEKAGHPLTRRGREFHGACPACGGADRLVVWPGPPGRHWCRRGCGVGGDAIAAARTLLGLGFFDATAHLAAGLDIAVPSARRSSGVNGRPHTLRQVRVRRHVR